MQNRLYKVFVFMLLFSFTAEMAASGFAKAGIFCIAEAEDGCEGKKEEKRESKFEEDDKLHHTDYAVSPRHGISEQYLHFINIKACLCKGFSEISNPPPDSI